MTENIGASGTKLMERTISSQLRYEELKRAIEKMSDLDEVKGIAITLAEQALLIQPASIRYMTDQAARNLVGAPVDHWLEEAEKLRHDLEQ